MSAPASQTALMTPDEPARPPASSSQAQPPSALFRSSAMDAAMGLYLPATLLVRLLNFARIVLMTWFMSTQQFGLLMMLLLVINVLTPLCSLGLNEAVTRYIPQYEARGALYDFIRRGLLLLTAVITAAMAFLVLAAPAMGQRFFGQLVYDPQIRSLVQSQLGNLTRLSALVIGLLAYYFFVLAVLKGLRMIRALALIELLHSAAFLALALVACAEGHRSAFTITACYGLSLLAALAFCGLGLSRTLRRWTAQHAPCAPARLYRRMLGFCQWAMIAGVTWQLLQYYPAWYLNKIHGNDAVAVFGAVRQIGQFILLAAVTIITVVMTTVTRIWETEGVAAADSRLSLAFRGTGTLLFLTCAALALAKDLLIRMFQPAYAPGAAILPLQLLFFLVGSHFAFVALHFNLIEKPRLQFLPYAIGVAANIWLGLWLVDGHLVALRTTPLWRVLEPLGSWLFVVGLSDRYGLGGASWAGALAILAALVSSLLLLRGEGRRIDRGSQIVLAVALLLAANQALLLLGTLLFAWLVCGTEVVFTRGERRELLGRSRAAFRTVFDPVARAARHDVRD